MKAFRFRVVRLLVPVLFWVNESISAEKAPEVEEISMGESVAVAAYEVVSRYRAPVPVSQVVVSMERELQSGTLQRIVVSAGKKNNVELNKELLSCVEEPLIEFPIVQFASIDASSPKQFVWERWAYSVLITFGVSNEKVTFKNGTVSFPRYPAVEYEFRGDRLARTRIWKSERDVRIALNTNGTCPKAMIAWALGRDVK